MSLERQGLKLAEVSAEVGKLTVENAHKQEAIDQLTMQKDLAEKALQEWKDKYSMLELHYKRLQDSIQPLSDQAQAQQSYKSLYEQVVVQNQQLHEALNQSNVKHEEQLKQVMEDVSAKDERRRTEIIRGHKQEILAKQIEITALKEELMQKDAVSEAAAAKAGLALHSSLVGAGQETKAASRCRGAGKYLQKVVAPKAEQHSMQRAKEVAAPVPIPKGKQAAVPKTKQAVGKPPKKEKKTRAKSARNPSPDLEDSPTPVPTDIPSPT
ncbi:hypothetical protein AK812_SmicGene46962, partial [Symbiodinium microadriaticum]